MKSLLLLNAPMTNQFMYHLAAVNNGKSVCQQKRNTRLALAIFPFQTAKKGRIFRQHKRNSHISERTRRPIAWKNKVLCDDVSVVGNEEGDLKK